ncbi:MAG: PilZ domain-containing protein [Gammaproteobacteria bacterium]|nr:PilZ domain-containing protein [Gammaproteobacteria bacterium]
MTDNLEKTASELQERRRSLRLDMESELVAISLKNASGIVKTKLVDCDNISQTGLSYINDEPIAIGEIVEVQTNPKDQSCPTLRATVLRCDVQQSGWYNIGLFFQICDEKTESI